MKSNSTRPSVIKLCVVPLLIAFHFAASPLYAKAAADEHGNTAPRATQTDASAPYALAADDQISIKVINWPDFNTTVVVAPDGTITVPMLSPINVTGKTPEEVSQILTSQWKAYVINPSVTVTLVQKRKQDVLLYGGLSRTGTIDYTPQLHLVQAVAEMGGASADGDLTKVSIVHATGQSDVVDLSHPESAQDILLAPGDVVYVPQPHDQVAVLGEVTKPGNVSFAQARPATVLDALDAAGGVKSTADLSNARLTHNGVEQPLDLSALLNRGDMSANVHLSPGDRLLIPANHRVVYVFGEVARPGFYPVQPGDRILDVLKYCGGQLQDGDLARVQLISVDKQNNTAKVKTVDVSQFLSKGNLQANELLHENENLYIPQRKKHFQIQDLLGVLSGLSLVGQSARLLSGGL